MKKLLTISLAVLGFFILTPNLNAQVVTTTSVNNTECEPLGADYDACLNSVCENVDTFEECNGLRDQCQSEFSAFMDCELEYDEASGKGGVVSENPSISDENGGSGNAVNVASGSSASFDYDGPVFDGPGLTGGATMVEGRIDGNVSRERNLKELIIGWTNFLLSITAILAVVALVWAGFLYVTAFGDDSRMETAKKIVIWVVGGILLILGAYAIVNTVMQAVF